MKFTLFYRGDLKSKRGAADKHELRKHFHKQLKELWQHLPLCDNQKFLNPNPSEGEISVIQEVGDFQFAPIITSHLYMTAELQLTILRPGPPGSLITHGGDIDNRLKTLLDALKVPSEPGALPKEAKPLKGEVPFFTLFEDDRLISRISVKTDRLLDADAGQSEVLLLLDVRTHVSRAIWANIGLSG